MQDNQPQVAHRNEKALTVVFELTGLSKRRELYGQGQLSNYLEVPLTSSRLLANFPHASEAGVALSGDLISIDLILKPEADIDLIKTEVHSIITRAQESWSL